MTESLIKLYGYHHGAPQTIEQPNPPQTEDNPTNTAAFDKNNNNNEKMKPASCSQGEKTATMGPNLKALSEFPVGAIWRTIVGSVPSDGLGRDITLISTW